MMKQRKTFPKWIYKGNFGNNQRVHIYFGHINPPEVSLVYRNAAQDSLSMFVSLAAAAKQVSLQHRTQGFLWSCPIQNTPLAGKGSADAVGRTRRVPALGSVVHSCWDSPQCYKPLGRLRAQGKKHIPRL